MGAENAERKLVAVPEVDAPDAPRYLNEDVGWGWRCGWSAGYAAGFLVAELDNGRHAPETLENAAALAVTFSARLRAAGVRTREAAESLSADDRDRIVGVDEWTDTEELAWETALRRLERSAA